MITIIDFKDILYEDLKKDIIILLTISNIEEYIIIKIIFWIVKNTLSYDYRELLAKILKKYSFKKYFEDLNDTNDNFEKKIKINLYKILLDKEIEKLSDKCKENFAQVKSTIIQYSPIEIEEDSEGYIIKYIEFLNYIIIEKDLSNNKIFDYIEFFSVIKDFENNKIIND